jgi:heptaprenyl diphosphate synthase
LREGRRIGWQQRFLDSVEEWFDACEREAHHRIDGYIPSVADYLPLRKSTFGTDIFLACVEVHQDLELPSTLRRHPVIRRLEELLFTVTAAENDLVSLDQDEADRIPYNLIRAIRHETGCSREEAVEQVQHQVAETRTQIDAVIRYIPPLLRMIPGLSGRRKEYMAIYEHFKDIAFGLSQADRYTPSAASVTPDLERLRRELYYYPAAAPAHTGL